MSNELKEFPLFKSLWLKIKEPDKMALIIVNDDGSDERITYTGLFENTNRISRSLIKAGIGEGDTFAIVMRNHPEFLYCLSAALSLGAMVVPIDPRSRGAKLSFQIKNTRCAVTFFRFSTAPISSLAKGISSESSVAASMVLFISSSKQVKALPFCMVTLRPSRSIPSMPLVPS